MRSREFFRNGFLVLCIGFLSNNHLALADESGLKANIAVDLVGTAASRANSDSKNHFIVRESEVVLYGPIDSTFDGVLGLSAHWENGKSFFELHEATVGSSRLIPYSRIRMGQFFLGIGRLNSVHRHDWPFTSAPKVHKEFFGNEGVVDSGLEYSFAAPLDWPLELTAGVTQGWTFGHSHDAGQKPKTPTHYSRASTFYSLPFNGGLQLGLNYLGRVDSEGVRTQLAGSDLMLKWREGRRIPFLLQSEFWWRGIKSSSSENSESIGFYVFPQAQIIGDVYLGILYDDYRPIGLKDALGTPLDYSDQSYVPALTWKPSEFVTFRSGYRWKLEKRESSQFKVIDSHIELQCAFILGSHPAHDF